MKGVSKEKMYKTYKYKLYPNKEQEEQLYRLASLTRTVYNMYITEINKNIPDKRSRGYTYKELTLMYEAWSKNKEHLRKVKGIAKKCLLSDIAQQSVSYAFQCCKKETEALKPKQKKSNKEYSYVNVQHISEDSIQFEGVTGEISVKSSLEHMKAYSRVRCVYLGGSWFLYFNLYENATVTGEKPYKKVIGIDVGVKDLAITSDGIKYPSFYNYEGVRKEYYQLDKMQNQLKKKVSKSNNYRELQQKIQKKQLHINNKRKNYLYTIVNDIMLQKPTHIVIESENITELSNHQIYGNAVFQQGWTLLRSYLKYKCKEQGVQLVYADKSYASSKLCSVCGEKKKDLQVSDRLYVCDCCGAVLDRDINAARNLKNLVK